MLELSVTDLPDGTGLDITGARDLRVAQLVDAGTFACDSDTSFDVNDQGKAVYLATD
ncbi:MULTISPECIES: hypothetical protein [unclassified Nocardioides]|uniref:hypothetical protein n=1 Tax=unclassified Nocardioides TaxID=2615069 RepID=UPI00032676B3|nr:MULTISPECIES: hypothetical protein [unclassified Nocardioides]